MEYIYKNYHKYQKARIPIIKRSKGKCEICGDIAYYVHHMDNTKSNHSLDNLIHVCRPCHHIFHSKDPYRWYEYDWMGDDYRRNVDKIMKLLKERAEAK
jgi:hypothetical protein